MNYEISLVLFTTLTQTAVGLSLFTAWKRQTAGEAVMPVRNKWLLVWLLTSAGLVISLFHLGKPLMAYTALKNFSMSSLSREGLVFPTFALLAFLCLILKSPPRGLGAATAAIGILGVVVQGMTYAAPGFPAINNAWPLVWFAMAAFVCGAALFMALGSEGAADRLLIAGCLLFLLSLTGIPFLWTGSDNRIIQDSAALWFSSPFYWAALVCIAAAAFSAIRKLDAKITLLLCVAGVLLSRMVFFASTVHFAANIGGVY